MCSYLIRLDAKGTLMLPLGISTKSAQWKREIGCLMCRDRRPCVTDSTHLAAEVFLKMPIFGINTDGPVP